MGLVLNLCKGYMVASGATIEFSHLEYSSCANLNSDNHLAPLNPNAQLVLDQLSPVFQEHKGLRPPSRNHDHAMTSLSNFKPGSVPPYYYAYHHMHEIEC